MKDLEMQHLLWESKRDLERQIQRPVYGTIVMCRSQSLKGPNKSTIDYIPWRDVSGWAKTVDETRTPIRSPTRFDVCP